MEKDKALKKIKILAVDDVIANCEVISAYIDVLGCQCDLANSGMEAIKKIKENNYDICFMDLLMPEMSGLETTRFIRKELSKDLPIVALTASTERGVKEKCFDVGMNDFINKPIELMKMKEAIYNNIPKLKAKTKNI